MAPAAYILQEIAGQDGDGGADVAAIHSLVEQRQGIVLDDAQHDKVTMSRQAWVRLCGSLGLAGS